MELYNWWKEDFSRVGQSKDGMKNKFIPESQWGRQID